MRLGDLFSYIKAKEYLVVETFCWLVMEKLLINMNK